VEFRKFVVAVSADPDVHLICDNHGHPQDPRHPRLAGLPLPGPPERGGPGARRPAMAQQLEPGPKTVPWNKTAEDILQSPSKYTAKIFGAGH
jgi:hypothetical protein